MRDETAAVGRLHVQPAALHQAAGRLRLAAEALSGQSARMRTGVPAVGDGALQDVAEQLATRVARLLAAQAHGIAGLDDGLTAAAARYAEVDQAAVPASAGPCLGAPAPGEPR